MLALAVAVHAGRSASHSLARAIACLAHFVVNFVHILFSGCGKTRQQILPLYLTDLKIFVDDTELIETPVACQISSAVLNGFCFSHLTTCPRFSALIRRSASA
jgi:hypothetical protein